jgi:hypothetical protein
LVAWLGLMAIATVLVVQMRLDAHIWGSRLTPGVLLTAGYTAVAAVYAVASLAYELHDEVTYETYALLCLMGALAAGVSFVVCIGMSWRKVEATKSVPHSGPVLRYALIVVAIGFAVAAWQLTRDAGGLWASDSRAPLASGWVGHFHVLLAFLVIWYAIGTTDRSMVRYCLIVLGLFALSLYPVKGWTLIPLVAIALHEAQKNRTRVVWPLLAAGLVGAMIFFGIYISRAELDDISPELFLGVLDQVFNHFLFYLTSGFAGLDKVVNGLELSGGLAVLFAPMANLGALLTDREYVGVISDVYVESLFDHPTGGNVFSMLGSLIGYVGLVPGIYLATGIVAFGYLVLAGAWRLRSAAAQAAVAYLLALFSFGWFEYYLWHVTPYEIAVFATVAWVTEHLLRRHE